MCVLSTPLHCVAAVQAVPARLMVLSDDRPFQQWMPLTDPGVAARENCTIQAIMAGAVGGVAGMALGAVLAPFNNSTMANMETEGVPLRVQFRRGMKEVGSQSKSWGKNLMVIGAVFSVSECFVEKARGTKDRWNPIVGGCITGGALAVSGATPTHPAGPMPSHALLPTLRCLRVCSRSWPASHGHRLRWLRSLLRRDRRDGLRRALVEKIKFLAPISRNHCAVAGPRMPRAHGLSRHVSAPAPSIGCTRSGGRCAARAVPRPPPRGASSHFSFCW